MTGAGDAAELPRNREVQIVFAIICRRAGC